MCQFIACKVGARLWFLTNKSGDVWWRATDALKRVPTFSGAKALSVPDAKYRGKGFSPSRRRDQLQLVRCSSRTHLSKIFIASVVFLAPRCVIRMYSYSSVPDRTSLISVKYVQRLSPFLQSPGRCTGAGCQLPGLI
jgi:hypothetical protein